MYVTQEHEDVLEVTYCYSLTPLAYFKPYNFKDMQH